MGFAQTTQGSPRATLYQPPSKPTALTGQMTSMVDALLAQQDNSFKVAKFSELTPSQMEELTNAEGMAAFKQVTINSKIEELVNAERAKQAKKAERRAVKEAKREEARRREMAAQGLTQNKLSKRARKALENL